MSAINQYFGKYRGTVINNIDNMQIGRIQVMVPDVSALIPSSWAMPCMPIAGKQMGTYVAKMKGAQMDDFLKSFELITPTKTQRMKWIWSIVRYAIVDGLINLTRMYIETRSFLVSWVKAWRYTANLYTMLIAH